jgi:hypothetical protein
LIRRRGPDASSTLSGKCVGQFPAKRLEAKSGETRHHAPDQIWSRQPLNWRAGQLELGRGGAGRGRAARPPGGHRRSATSCPSDSARDRGRTWGLPPVTCRRPTPLFISQTSRLCPNSSSLQQLSAGCCCPIPIPAPHLRPLYSLHSLTSLCSCSTRLSPPLRVATRFESWRHRKSAQREFRALSRRCTHPSLRTKQPSPP